MKNQTTETARIIGETVSSKLTEKGIIVSSSAPNYPAEGQQTIRQFNLRLSTNDENGTPNRESQVTVDVRPTIESGNAWHFENAKDGFILTVYDFIGNHLAFQQYQTLEQCSADANNIAQKIADQWQWGISGADFGTETSKQDIIKAEKYCKENGIELE